MALALFEQKPVSPPTLVRFYQSERPWRIVEKTQESLTPQKWPNLNDLVTEDDDPVDNIFSEKQQRLLTESLYNDWEGPGQGRSFLTLANVGLFYAPDKPTIVPDILVSLDVSMPQEVWQKHHRCYFVSEYKKPPEVVIEIVSNLKGKEAGTKQQDYAEAGVRYYVIFDPELQLKKGMLRVYELQNKTFVEKTDRWLSGVGLGLMFWEGRFEDKDDEWLRWCDKNDQLILTGTETTQQERQEKEQALLLAEQERWEKEQERREKEQALFLTEQVRREKETLAAKLRALGIDPDEL